MSVEHVTILLFGSMFLFLALGVPVAFVFGGLSVLFIVFLWGPSGLSLVALKTFGMMRTITLLAIPLFIGMAALLERSGIAQDLYDMMYSWAGPLRGALAAGTVSICTIIAAMSGAAATGTVTMGLIALPAMLKRGYDKKLATGCIMAGGALGPLIPPSVVMVIYGGVTGVSIGQLFMGGVFPGLLLSAIFIVYILVRARLNPSIAPSLPREERANWRQKFTSLRAVILPLLLVVSVLGSIFAGIATPTEAAAVGALGCLVCAAIHRRLDWTLLKDAAVSTMKMTGMIVWILFTAGMFVSVYQGLGAPELLKGLVTKMPVNEWGMLIFIQVIFFILGCLMNNIAILMITYPVFLPLIDLFGYNPLWFAILFFLNCEMGYLTPPFGPSLFFMKGVAPKGITIGDIYRSIIPFVILQTIGLIIVMLFPPIATWLPSLWK